MARLDVRLEGADELKRALLELPRVVARKVVRQAAREAGRPIEAQAKREAPDDTGTLKRSIKLRAIKRTRKLIGVTIRTGTPTELGNPVARYAGAQEYGAPLRNMPAQPYLRPALFENDTKALGILSRVIGAGIEREAAKLAASKGR